MAKNYRIDIYLGIADVERNSRRAVAALGTVDAAATRSAASQQRAADRAAEARAKAAQRAAERERREYEKAARDYDRRMDQQTRAAERAADKKARETQRAGEKERRENEKAARDYDRRMERETRAAERQADREAKAAERARQKVERENEKAARDYDRRMERAQRAADRQADREVRAAERAAAKEERLRHKVLTDEEINLRVRNKLVDQHNQRRIDAAMRAAGVEDKTFSAGVIGLAKMATGALALRTAWRAATASLEAYNRAYALREEQSRERAGTFVSTRDKLGELASIRDRPLDNAFVMDFRRFNKATGLKEDESLRFQESFYNSGAQYIGEGPGKHMTAAQGEIFKDLVAKFAVANHIEPGVMGDLAGNLLSGIDFSKDPNAAQNALGRLNQVFQIGKRGRGANPVLLAQMVKGAATMMRENAEQGIFTSPEEVMTGISVMAERNPEDAEIYLRRATEGLRGFGDKKIGPLLKRANITAADSVFGAAGKLLPVIRKESKERGEKDYDTLKRYFDEREAAGIATLLGRGIEGGVIADRTAYGRKFAGPAPALDQITAYQASEAGQQRRAEADKILAESEKGEINSALVTLRQQAHNRLIREKRIDTPGVALRQFAGGVMTLGMGDYSNEALIDLEAERMLMERVPGLNVPHHNFGHRREEILRGAIRAAREREIDPLSGLPFVPTAAMAPGAAADPGIKTALDRHREALEKNTRALENKAGGPAAGVPAPAPMPGPRRAGALRPGG